MILSITDELGRIVLTGTENSAGDNATIDTQDYIDWVSTEFDDNQRPYRSSNPISLGSSVEPVSNSFSWTTNSYDGLDRVTSITTPDGQSVTMTYQDNQELVTDQVGAKKLIFYDGLGRISQVRMANPATNSVTAASAYDTGYSYDEEVRRRGQLSLKKEKTRKKGDPDCAAGSRLVKLTNSDRSGW